MPLIFGRRILFKMHLQESGDETSSRLFPTFAFGPAFLRLRGGTQGNSGSFSRVEGQATIRESDADL